MYALLAKYFYISNNDDLHITKGTVDYIWFCLILNFEKKLTYYSALLATKIDFLLFRKKYKKIRLKN